MSNHKLITALLSASALFAVTAATKAQPAPASTAPEIRVVTYNVENFRFLFDGSKLTDSRNAPTTQPTSAQPTAQESVQRDILSRERRDDDEECWEVASVILHPDVNPDILMVQESAAQAELEAFNTRWLNSAYATVIQFPTNTNALRGQHLSMFLKPGYKVLEQVHLFEDKDPTADGMVPDRATTPAVDVGADPDSRGGRLFARGPTFVLVEAPSGYKLWIGNTHQKAKAGNSVEVTKWRNREAARTLEVMKSLRARGTKDVLLVGDFNDSLGVQQFEAEGHGDTIGNMAADPAFVLLTKSIAETPNAKTFGGYWRRSGGVIDHALATSDLAPRFLSAHVFDQGLAPVASDHFPVVIRLNAKP